MLNKSMRKIHIYHMKLDRYEPSFQGKEHDSIASWCTITFPHASYSFFSKLSSREGFCHTIMVTPWFFYVSAKILETDICTSFHTFAHHSHIQGNQTKGKRNKRITAIPHPWKENSKAKLVHPFASNNTHS